MKGHAMLLLLSVLAGLAAVGAAVSVRLSVDVEGRREEDLRLQALWLARSAVSAGKAGALKVDAGAYRAQVKTTVTKEASGRRVISTVTLEKSGTATVEALVGKAGAPLEWRERYDRALPPR